MYQNTDYEMTDVEKSNMDTEMLDISQDTCQFCTNEHSVLCMIICQNCQKFMCKTCYSKGYWVAKENSQSYIFKIPEFQTELNDSIIGSSDDIHYVCGLDCTQSFLTK